VIISDPLRLDNYLTGSIIDPIVVGKIGITVGQTVGIEWNQSHNDLVATFRALSAVATIRADLNTGLTLFAVVAFSTTTAG
jgi:hypothetical protein